MSVDYDHSANAHTLDGPTAALPKLFSEGMPASLLDVGCGTGTWLRAAMDLGVRDVFGIDGVEIPGERLLFPREYFLCRNLSEPVDLGRRFSAAICLEVAEHLEADSGKYLIQTLTKHADFVLFSAACPGQTGQHHVNCQWPAYWQELFNQCSYVCSDEVRWRIWEDSRVEPWYRQNLFIARRDPTQAGKEPRIRAVLHPEIAKMILQETISDQFPYHVAQIECGQMPVGWYLGVPFRALANKLGRRLRNAGPSD